METNAGYMIRCSRDKLYRQRWLVSPATRSDCLLRSLMHWSVLQKAQQQQQQQQQQLQTHGKGHKRTLRSRSLTDDCSAAPVPPPVPLYSVESRAKKRMCSTTSSAAMSAAPVHEHSSCYSCHQLDLPAGGGGGGDSWDQLLEWSLGGRADLSDGLGVRHDSCTIEPDQQQCVLRLDSGGGEHTVARSRHCIGTGSACQYDTDEWRAADCQQQHQQHQQQQQQQWQSADRRCHSTPNYSCAQSRSLLSDPVFDCDPSLYLAQLDSASIASADVTTASSASSSWSSQPRNLDEAVISGLVSSLTFHSDTVDFV